MSNAIEEVTQTDQIRFNERLILGRDPLTAGYNVVNADSSGNLAARQYVWDTNTLNWVAMANPDSGTITNYDEIDIGYTGSNMTTVVYKLAGVTVSTLTMTYSGSNITKVTRT